MGFEYFYGFMGGETDQWTPYLFRDHTQIFPWVEKPDYNLTTDMADQAIDFLRTLDAVAPDKPFFLYVPGGSHSPHQPKKEWIDKFKGKFDMGWNAMRDEIFANQKRLGVIPLNAQLTPRPDELPRGNRERPKRRTSSPARRRCSRAIPPIPTTRSGASFSKSRTWASSTTR
jgi:arylsulfatase A-like enzyme